MLFKVGDTITPREYCTGFINARIINITESYKGRMCYVLDIGNGIATVPISVESNYKLV